MKKVYLIIGLIAAFSVFILGTKIVLAEDPSFGLDATAGAAKLDNYGKDVPTIAGNIIGTLLSMISVLFFVLILYGGILWMTARGSSETTEKALNTIIAATIGIIIIIGAYALTNFVFKLGANAGGGSDTSPGGGAITQWCLTVEKQCVQGAGGPCSGTGPFSTEAACNAARNTSSPVCGNGTKENGEACDDGNTLNNDGCSETCSIEIPDGGSGQGA